MTTYISFSAEISPQTTETLIAVLGEQANNKVDEVYLMFSTPGSLLQDQRRIGDIIREHTKLDARKIRNLFREARTKDADYAKSVGIVHDIRDVKIPPGNPIISLVFQR